MKKLKHILLYVLTAFFPVGILNAQPESAGTAFSYGYIGLEYQHALSEDTFLNICLKAETGEMFSGRSTYPGICTSFSWNLILKTWTSRNGNPIDLFAGPGALIGYGPDFKERNGISFGLKGRLGVQCRFARNCSISLAIAPTMGMHMVFHKEYISLNYFKNGLIYGFIPELGIRYWF